MGLGYWWVVKPISNRAATSFLYLEMLDIVHGFVIGQNDWVPNCSLVGSQICTTRKEEIWDEMVLEF